MSDNVIFQPPGPFGLPAAQQATARSVNGAVELRIRALVREMPETLAIQMTRAVAQEMAVALLDAAAITKG